MEKERKTQIIDEYKRHDGDTGSSEVQVALLTERINHLNEHLKSAPARQPFPPRPSENGRSAQGTFGLYQGERH